MRWHGKTAASARPAVARVDSRNPVRGGPNADHLVILRRSHWRTHDRRDRGPAPAVLPASLRRAIATRRRPRRSVRARAAPRSRVSFGRRERCASLYGINGHRSAASIRPPEQPAAPALFLIHSAHVLGSLPATRVVASLQVVSVSPVDQRLNGAAPDTRSCLSARRDLSRATTNGQQGGGGTVRRSSFFVLRSSFGCVVRRSRACGCLGRTQLQRNAPDHRIPHGTLDARTRATDVHPPGHQTAGSETAVPYQFRSAVPKGECDRGRDRPWRARVLRLRRGRVCGHLKLRDERSTTTYFGEFRVFCVDRR